MKAPRLLRELNWFVVVGIAATGCHVGATLAVHRLFGLAPMVASLVGYASSVGVSYFGNSRLTFRRKAMDAAQFGRFAAISLAGLAVNQALVYSGTHILGWPLWRAMIPVAVIVPASTFLLSKFWAFRAPAIEPAA